LVSVRGPDEVDAAVLGGAGLIDVKEPDRGALGRADDEVIAAVIATVAGRRPVSAAMGELMDWGPPDAPVAVPAGLRYVKIGLAGCGRRRGWAGLLAGLRTQIEAASAAKLVAVAYADWRRADAPRPDEVISFALSNQCAAFLIDTWEKDGSTLLDWMTLTELSAMCDHFRGAGVTVALAGALGRWQIRQLLPAQPDWFAVRGSACAGEGRGGPLSRPRVERLAAVFADPESVAHDSRLDIQIPDIHLPPPLAQESP
jgi:uncharacterized protein (UPF0264 family)